MSEPTGESEGAATDAAFLRGVAALLYGDAPFFAGILDPDGTLRYANDTALAVVGANEASVRDSLFWETPWWSHDPVQQRRLRERVEAAADGDVQEFSATHATAGGDLIDVEVTVRPLSAPDDDELADALGAAGQEDVFALVVTGVDVTERADLAAARQATLDALEGLYEAAADPGLSFEERVHRLLQIGKERLGLSEGFYTKIDGGVQRIRVSDADHPLLQEGEHADLADSYCKRTVSEEDPVVMSDVTETAFAEDSAYDVYGLECYIGAELEVDGAVHGTVCFADTEPRTEPIDATERAFVDLLAEWLSNELEHRHQQRSLERQNERLDRYAGVVSHDLRSPLNVATGHLDLAREELPEDTPARDHLETVEGALDRMNELVEGMRTLAKQGEVVGDPERVSLSGVARDAAETALPASASLTVKTDGGDVVFADPERLRTLFENLFRNAVEHGGEDVAVTVGVVDPRTGGGAGFYVADDGPGFEQDDPGVVFEEGVTTREDGTGYGLSIVEAIVDAHDWSVSAGASESGGARVDVTGVEVAPDV